VRFVYLICRSLIYKACECLWAGCHDNAFSIVHMQRSVLTRSNDSDRSRETVSWFHVGSGIAVIF
jgi:hypothetical protein